jgi:hypothetical protein
MRAWCWLLGRDDIVAFIEEPGSYENYGAPILARIAEEFGVEVPDDEDFIAMSRGEVCPSCQRGDMRGCGS